MICIECSAPVPSLYDKYKGDHIRLTVCQNCDHVADKYIEFDTVLLFIDLMLLRAPAYRHTIYNYLIEDAGCSDRSDTHGDSGETESVTQLQVFRQTVKSKFKRYSTSLRLLLLMLLFEVYLTWAYEEKNHIDVSRNMVTFRVTSKMSSLVLSNNKILLQYGFFILKALLEFLMFHFSIQLLAYYYLGFGVSKTMTFQYLAPLDTSDSILRERSLTPERRRGGNGNSAAANGGGISRDISPLRRSQQQQQRSIHVRSLSPALSVSEASTSSANTTPTPSPTSIVVVEEISYSSDYFMAVISTAILLSNLIKIFPIVMLIWPYDNFILNITKAMVNIIHTTILIETLHTALLKQNHTDYWNVILVVLISNIVKTVTTNFILCSITSHAFEIPLWELAYDELWIRYKNGLLLISYLSVFQLTS